MDTFFQNINRTLFGEDGNSGMLKSIETFVGNIAGMDIDPGAGYKIQAVTQVMSAITSFIPALIQAMPEPSMLESFLTTVGGGLAELGAEMSGGPYRSFGDIKAAKALKFMTDAIKTLTDPETGILDSIQAIVESAGGALRGLNPEQIKGIGPVTQMLGSMFRFLSDFSKNMSLDPESIKSITDGGTREGIDAAERIVNALPTNMATSFQTIMNSIKDNIGPIIGALSTGLSGFSTTQIENVGKGAEAIASILTGFSSFINNIKELGMEEIRTAASGDAAETVFRTFSGDNITRLITSVGEVVRAIFNPDTGGIIRTIVQSLLNSGITALPRNIGDKAKAVVDILGLVNAVNTPEFAAATRGGTAGAAGVDITSRIANAGTIIGTIVNELGTVIRDRGFQTNINAFTKTLTERMQRIPETLSVVSSILGSVSSDNFNANGVTDKINQVRDTMVELVAKVNEINSELLNLDPININTGLQRLGNVLGVNNGELTINNRSFTIEVNFNVSIDARDLENILVDRARVNRNRLVVRGEEHDII